MDRAHVTAADHANTVREALNIGPLPDSQTDRDKLDAGHDALDALQAQAERHICPVCGGEEWDIDYDYNGEDEMRVDRCAQCQWPPTYPSTVAEHKRKYFFSPYLSDMEAALKAAEAERDRLREEIDKALHELGVPNDGYPAPVANAVEILRAALAGEDKPRHPVARNLWDAP